MADAVLFVDSVAASPTTRLDLNGTTWRVESFDPGVPPTTTVVGANAMRDGGYVSSSSRGMRVLSLVLTRTSTTQDANATSIQALMRELDRESNWLKFQPDGATAPVFFKTYRATPATIQYVWTAAAHHRVELQLLADPWALGLRTSLGPYTVTNNPASANYGCYVDLTGVIGDVSAPLVIVAETNSSAVNEPDGPQWIATSRTQQPTTRYYQCESFTLGTDTTNPGGAADAAMSGSGTTNYARTSFATATMLTRISTLSMPSTGGLYRLIVGVRKSAASDGINIRANFNGVTGTSVSPVTITARQYLDLGTFDFPQVEVGDAETPNAVVSGQTLSIQAERTSGAGTLDWDCLIWLPADEQVAVLSGGDLGGGHLVDGTHDLFSAYSSGDPMAGTAVNLTATSCSVSGAFPYVAPNQTNRVYMIANDSSGADVTLTRAVTFYYWPRYLFIRPATT